jgi:hypothetical protein
MVRGTMRQYLPDSYSSSDSASSAICIRGEASVARNMKASEHHARPPEAKQRPAGERDTRGEQTSLSCARMRAQKYRSPARMHPRGPSHTACACGLTCPCSDVLSNWFSFKFTTPAGLQI